MKQMGHSSFGGGSLNSIASCSSLFAIWFVRRQMILLAIGVTIPDEHTILTPSFAIGTAGVDLVLIHPTLRGVLRFGTIDQTMKATRIVDGGNLCVGGRGGEKGEGR